VASASGMDSRITRYWLVSVKMVETMRWPILMTTLAALFAAVPLMLGFGEGAELRRPLGLAIFGGLIVSQVLTLFTTPVIYLAFDRMGQRFGRKERVDAAVA